MDEAVEMIDQTIPAGDDAFVFVQPGEQAFDLPAPAVTPERPLILCLGFDAITFVRGNQLNALGSKPEIERITVVGAIPNKSLGSSHGEGFIEGNHNEGAVVGVATILLAAITLGLTIFTRGLMIYTRRLWGATDTLVIDAKETSKKQLRAYIVVKEGILKSLDEPKGKVEIINTGQTPARDVTAWINATLRPYPLTTPLEFNPPKIQSP